MWIYQFLRWFSNLDATTILYEVFAPIYIGVCVCAEFFESVSKVYKYTYSFPHIIKLMETYIACIHTTHARRQIKRITNSYSCTTRRVTTRCVVPMAYFSSHTFASLFLVSSRVQILFPVLWFFLPHFPYLQFAGTCDARRKQANEWLYNNGELLKPP